MVAVRVGIVGDFDAGKHSHWATEAALFHAAARIGVEVVPSWVPTPRLEELGAARSLEDFNAIWGAPGSPYASFEGMLSGIEFARTRDVPYLGTCGGFQYALIEFTRHVLGIADADTAENAPAGENTVITLITCELPQPGKPRLFGRNPAIAVGGTLVANLSAGVAPREEYFCSFETNPGFIERWEEAGLRVAARSADGEMRAFELPDRRFFLATLYQPQLSSSYLQPHPIIEGFLRAGAQLD